MHFETAYSFSKYQMRTILSHQRPSWESCLQRRADPKRRRYDLSPGAE